MPATHQATNGGFRAEELGRRQFQKATVDTFNAQSSAIVELRATVKAQGEFLADLSVRIDGLHKSAQFEENERVAIGKFLYAFQRAGLFARLKWLVFGA